MTPDRWPLLVTSFLAVFVGGAAGWTAAFAGVGVGGLVLGAIVTVGAIGAAASRMPRGALRLMLGFAPAFALICWPALYIGVGFVRYWLTGETLGS